MQDEAKALKRLIKRIKAHETKDDYIAKQLGYVANNLLQQHKRLLQLYEHQWRRQLKRNVARAKQENGDARHVLPDALVVKARQLRKDNPKHWTWAKLGRKFKVSGQTIMNAVLGTTYKHITD